MDYTVTRGFIDVVENEGYRTGDPFVVGDKTDKKRLAHLMDYGFIAPKAVEAEPVKDEPLGDPENKEPINTANLSNTKASEPVKDELDSLDLEALKDVADALGVGFAVNIGKDTLIKKIREFEAKQGE